MDSRQPFSSPVPDTTTTLLEKLAATGAPEAEWARFARLYDPVCRYYLAVLRRGWPSLRRDWDDDIVQETFLGLVQALPEHRWERSRGRFRDFLFGVVRNKAREFARREGRVEAASAETLEKQADPMDDCGAEAEREALRHELWRALLDRVFAAERLMDTSKEIFRRLIEEEVPVETLAAEFDTTPNAIYRLKNRMTKKLREAWLASAGPDGDATDALENLAKEILYPLNETR